MMNWCSKHRLFEICPECMQEQREAEERRKWDLNMARLEDGSEIGAGPLAADPTFDQSESEKS